MSAISSFSNASFVYPFIFLLIPLPFFVYRYFSPSSFCQMPTLKIPALEDFDFFKEGTKSRKDFFKLLFLFSTFIFLLLAAARPQQLKEPIEIPKTGRDLMLAIDLSDSMQIKDFQFKGQYIDRLTALKAIAGDFIEKRKGDRIGLILYGSNAYTQAPLTFDTATVKQFLYEAEVGLAGPKTAIGDAIGLAIKKLNNKEEGPNEKNKVLILLTDGNHNAGELTPEKAAELAKKIGLKIHTVAIGSKSLNNGFGRGQGIDEKALQTISKTTGGNYFFGSNTKELKEIYDKIDQLETTEKAQEYFLPVDELYRWPLMIALIFFAIVLCL